MEWNPNHDLLQQVAGMMQCTLAPDTKLQKQAYDALETHIKNPEFVRYLAFLFARCGDLGPAVRAAAGLTLKRIIDTSYTSLPHEVQRFVRLEVQRSLADPAPEIRQTAANAVSAIVRDSSLLDWPELSPSLVALLDPSNAAIAADGALTAITHLSEDVSSQFDSAELGHPLVHLIPLLIQWMRAPQEKARRDATKCVTNFVYTMAPAVQSNLDAILSALAALTQDSSPAIRKVVCYAFCTLTELRADRVWPLLQPIIQFHLRCTVDADSEVALAACDFWSVLMEVLSDSQDNVNSDEMTRDVQPALGDIVRALLARMVLTDDDLASMPTDDSGDAGVADREQDIRPHIYRTRAGPAGQASAGGATTGDGSGATAPQQEEEEEEEPDDGSDPHAEVQQWTVRRAAASALDSLTLVFGGRVLPALLPELNARLSAGGDDDASWRAREVGVLALGAVAEGCWDGISEYMGQLYPYLVTLSADRRPLVRAISLWCLSKYVPWALEQELTDEAQFGRYFEPLVCALQPRLLDAHKKVQEAACAAALNIAEQAQGSISQYAPALVSTYVTALVRYQAKNRLHLYDAIGALAESIGEDIATPEIAHALLPPLMARFDALQDEEPELVPLLECLTALVTSMGPLMSLVAPLLFSRALRLVEADLIKDHAQQQATAAAAAAAAGAAPAASAVHHRSAQHQNELLVAGLDLLGGLAEGFKASFAQLVGAHSAAAAAGGSNGAATPHRSLLELVFESCKVAAPPVRQSAFALLGELAKYCMEELRPHAPRFLVAAAASMRDSQANIHACNNAIWAAGEIVVRVKPTEAAAVAPIIFERLVAIINNRTNSRALMENSAICLGRLARVVPDAMAPRLGEFVRNWLKALTLVSIQEEREQAYGGLCVLLQRNPASAAECLADVLLTFAVADGVSQELRYAMLSLVSGYRSSLPPGQWAAQTAPVGAQLKAQLRTAFGVDVLA